jgi:hypothetical protein
MSESVALDSGSRALAAFAYESGLGLDETVQSLKLRNRRVDKFQDELRDLCNILSELTEAVAASEIDLSALDRILFQCGSACSHFEQDFIKCASESGNGVINLLDLTYIGENIDWFAQLLAIYTDVITIALDGTSL